MCLTKMDEEEDNNDNQLIPKIGMEFETEQATYEFYNSYGAKLDLALERIVLTEVRRLTKLPQGYLFVPSKGLEALISGTIV